MKKDKSYAAWGYEKEGTFRFGNYDCEDMVKALELFKVEHPSVKNPKVAEGKLPFKKSV